VLTVILPAKKNIGSYQMQNDRAERHVFYPRLWLFSSPIKKEGRRKGE